MFELICLQSLLILVSCLWEECSTAYYSTWTRINKRRKCESWILIYRASIYSRERKEVFKQNPDVVMYHVWCTYFVYHFFNCKKMSFRFHGIYMLNKHVPWLDSSCLLLISMFRVSILQSIVLFKLCSGIYLLSTSYCIIVYYSSDTYSHGSFNNN